MMAGPTPSRMPHLRISCGSERQASAMTTALSPLSRTLIQTISPRASQNVLSAAMELWFRLQRGSAGPRTVPARPETSGADGQVVPARKVPSASASASPGARARHTRVLQRAPLVAGGLGLGAVGIAQVHRLRLASLLHVDELDEHREDHGGVDVTFGHV